MYGLRRILFETGLRRGFTTVITLALYVSAGQLIHGYVDVDCASPGVSFVLLFLWLILAAVSALLSLIALGDYLIGPGFVDDLLKDEMAELDARLEGEDDNDDDDDPEVLMRRGQSGSRFGLYFLVFFLGLTLIGNSLSDGFLQRYSHPGVALIHLRSDDPSVRRRGIEMLTKRLDFTPTPEVEKLVLRALNDPDEGVVARAAQVAAIFDMTAATAPIISQIQSRPALSFALLIALGQIGGEAPRAAAMKLANMPEARAEPAALAYALGLLRVPAVKALTEIHDAAKDDENARLAAVWALGQMRDARLLTFMSRALQDKSLRVRCAAIEAFEWMVVTESAPRLMAAFEAENDPHLYCPEVNLPVQEGGAIIEIVRYRKVMFSILRALATTDHPALLTWLVERQEDTDDYRTRVFMKKLWENLKAKDARGDLNSIRRRLRQRALHEQQRRAQETEAQNGE